MKLRVMSSDLTSPRDQLLLKPTELWYAFFTVAAEVEIPPQAHEVGGLAMRVSRRDILFISSIGLPLVASQSCSNSTATAVAANGTPPTNPEQDLDRDFRVKFKV